MTEQNKRFALVGGTVLVAVLLLLLFRRGGGTVGGAGDYTLPAVTGPSLGPIYTGGTRIISIPGLDLSGPNLNMVGACCSDCMQTKPTFTNPTYPSTTNIYNAGNAGPNIYNYAAPAAPSGSFGDFYGVYNG